MRFSICIPNYNYAHYIGETIGSVLAQVGDDIDVVVSDNASTDNSAAVVRGFGDARVRLFENRLNVGFAENLDRAARRAIGERLITLSSDDVMRPGALDAYSRLLEALGPEERDRAIVGSSVDVIDENGALLRVMGIDWQMWTDAERDPALSEAVGADVYAVDAHALLARCMDLLRSPVPFASTCFSRWLYETAEGYGGGRLYNPDKWFIWKALALASKCYFIDKPLFGYRWHSRNQAALQRATGAMKHLVDQYVSTFELPPFVLAAAKRERSDIVNAFVKHDIGLRGLLAVAEGNRGLARRHLRFGKATYSSEIFRSREVWILRALLLLGPIGTLLAKAASGPATRSWKSRSETPPRGASR